MYVDVVGDFLDHSSDTLAISTSALCAMAALGGVSYSMALLLITSIYINASGLHWEATETGLLSLGNGTSITEGQGTLLLEIITLQSSSWHYI